MTFQGPPPDADRQGEGASYPQYLYWHAQGSAENQLPAASFSIRATGAGNIPQPSPHMAAGVVWDIEGIETGWQSWPKGGAKDYRANPTPSQPLPYPGAGFTECVKIPIALDPNTVACWDQASVGTWKGFCQIAAIIAQQAPQNPGLYPVIQLTGATLTSTGQNSTQVPNFAITKWVPQPPCFAPQAAAPVAALPQVPAAPAVATVAPPPAVAPPAPPAPAVPAAPAAPAAPAVPAGAWN